ncbi:MAG: GIY-YIG nuclease family protein [Pseudolabrys sp.]|nr:GIY-YIG nuclease family protein [Pseudolabrys sp.]MDP2296989.1 GIY-YIG nuclease family protein [Pseudolabrys sp.]
MSEHTANGLRQIKLFLVDGSPAGIIMADVVNWTGKVMSAPRARLGQLIRREEAERTGIYLLIGPDPDRINGLKVYVGEADNIRKRLRRHESDEEMDFFDRVAFVVSKDENLTKAHARFLESQIIRLTKEAGTVVLANSTEPEFSLLPEADRSDMGFFIEQLRTVLPILGFDLFRAADRRQMLLVGADEQSPVFELNAVGVRATAREADNGFIVLAGSIARRDGTPTFPRGYQGFRDQLIADSKLIEDGEPGLYRFTKDVSCPSPTAAAAIILARSVNGPKEWLVRGTGQTYKAWRAANLADHAEAN